MKPMPDKNESAKDHLRAKIETLLDQCELLSKQGIAPSNPIRFSKEELKQIYPWNAYKLHRIMCGEYVRDALDLLVNSGLLSRIIPVIREAIIFDETTGDGFKKVWPHTKIVISQTPPKMELRWAALFHDLGKPASYDNVKKVSFHGHEKLSSKLFKRFAQHWPLFDKEKAKRIERLIYHLGHVEAYENDWTDRAVRRFIRDVGDDILESLLQLAAADVTTSNEDKKRKIISRIEQLKFRISKVREEDSKQAPLPKGLGHRIIDELNVKPGKGVGDIMSILKAAIDDGLINPGMTSDYYISYLKTGIPVEDGQDRDIDPA